MAEDKDLKDKKVEESVDIAAEEVSHENETLEAEEVVDAGAQTSDDGRADLEAQLKRVMADFDNYRRRSEEEKKQLSSFVQAQTLLELAPVLDNFRRATEFLPKELESNNWAVGVLYVQKQLEQIFEQFGLEKIKTIGENFDPRLHEAISMESVEGTEPNKVLAEVESGYVLKGQVLKPARVKVSQ